MIALEPQVFDVLVFLASNPGRLVSTEELLDSVWGDRFVSDSAITSRIKMVRRALGDDGTVQRFVQTVRGRGYRFVADVASVSGADGGGDPGAATIGAASAGVLAVPPTGTVSFLFSEVEGAARAWDRHPVEMAAAMGRHDEVVASAIEGSGGFAFSRSTNSFAAAFNTVADAVDAAVAAQRMLAEQPWPASCPIRVRMGLHIGEAHEQGGDYHGPAVNKAAQIMACCHGGQILVSSAVAAVSRHPELVDLGQYRLKDCRGRTRPSTWSPRSTGCGEVLERGGRVSVMEWPDAELAWRAMRSTGPAVPALRHTDPDIVKSAVLEAIRPCRDSRGIYRFRNDHQFVIARKP